MSQKPWIKAIDTEYNGMLFRSRLEARWAVFFDAAKIKYEYEPEGFEHHGYRYLPDFYLPDLDTYIEVKPNREGIEKDIIKVGRLIYWGGPIKRIVFLGNIPGPCKDGGMWHFPCMYYSTLDQNDEDGIEYGWFYFFDKNEKTASGKISSSNYPSPFIIVSSKDVKGNWVRDEATGEMKLSDVTLDAISDVELGNKSIHNYINDYGLTIDEAIEQQIAFNSVTFNAFKKARCARFEFKHTK